MSRVTASVRKSVLNFVFDIKVSFRYNTTPEYGNSPGVTDLACCVEFVRYGEPPPVQLHQNRQGARSTQVPNVSKRS